MNLPSKDKNGNSYLSYSQISTFLKDKDQFIKTYILKEPFIGNEWTDFGSKVGKSIELNDYSGFTEPEQQTLKQVTRLDLFEQKISLNFDLFYMVGYIDTCSSDLTRIIDYKTGGKFKHTQYLQPDYTQLCYYVLGIRQETGIKVKEASVEFIHREGSLKTGLKVGSQIPLQLQVNISEHRLKTVYYDTIRIAKEISEFYEKYQINLHSKNK